MELSKRSIKFLAQTLVFLGVSMYLASLGREVVTLSTWRALALVGLGMVLILMAITVYQLSGALQEDRDRYDAELKAQEDLERTMGELREDK